MRAGLGAGPPPTESIKQSSSADQLTCENATISACCGCYWTGCSGRSATPIPDGYARRGVDGCGRSCVVEGLVSSQAPSAALWGLRDARGAEWFALVPRTWEALRMPWFLLGKQLGLVVWISGGILAVSVGAVGEWIVLLGTGLYIVCLGVEDPSRLREPVPLRRPRKTE
jgi:hypothetical protein